MVVGRKWILKNHYHGQVKKEDFQLVTEELPAIKDGEILYQALYISVDPYQRAHELEGNPPFHMHGFQVSKVLESKDKNFPVGCMFVSHEGWVERGILNPAKMAAATGGELSFPIVKAPDLKGLCPSHLVGACGMPGNTAYFGFLELCQPKAGETVYVNGSAGAVGSLVGQIAKIKGCKVVASAGTDDKVNWLKNDLKFDHVFNYKKTSVKEMMKQGAPNGVDCFFENIGGPDSAVILDAMNPRGRVSVCGAISTYNDKEEIMIPAFHKNVIFKQIKIEGFMVTRWMDRWVEGIMQMAKWIGEGKLKAEQTVVEGFEKVPEAFVGLFTGSNTGKMVVKI